MLVLTRKLGENIRIGDTVKITVLEVRSGQVKLGIEAPPEVKVHREEIYARIQEENRGARRSSGRRPRVPSPEEVRTAIHGALTSERMSTRPQRSKRCRKSRSRRPVIPLRHLQRGAAGACRRGAPRVSPPAAYDRAEVRDSLVDAVLHEFAQPLTPRLELRGAAGARAPSTPFASRPVSTPGGSRLSGARRPALCCGESPRRDGGASSNAAAHSRFPIEAGVPRAHG